MFSMKLYCFGCFFKIDIDLLNMRYKLEDKHPFNYRFLIKNFDKINVTKYYLISRNSTNLNFHYIFLKVLLITLFAIVK